MSLRDDRNWATEIYQERADSIDADQNVTYFFLKDYQEVCRYMRAIGYGSKGKAETVEKQVARELEIAMDCQRPRAGGGRRVGAAWASFCRFGYCPTLSSISRCFSPSINKSARLLSS